MRSIADGVAINAFEADFELDDLAAFGDDLATRDEEITWADIGVDTVAIEVEELDFLVLIEAETVLGETETTKETLEEEEVTLRTELEALS